MALFSRRTIQQIINENATFLTSSQIEDHVNRLNSASDLAAEWEIVILNAFSKFGKVIHEPTDMGTRRPDLCFCRPNNTEYSFIADITTISDDGLDKINQQPQFSQELNRILKKYNLNGNNFSYKIDGEKNKNFILQLKDYNSILNGIFISFLKNEVLTNLSSHHTFTHKSKNSSFSISYIPNQRYQTGSHVSYTASYTLKNNPVYNGLKGKYEQLKEINFNGSKGIILCDGSCSLLKVTSKASGSYTYKEIIQRFLENSITIDFVITIIPFYQEKNSTCTRAELYLNPKTSDSKVALPNINRFLPSPISNVQNARYRLLDDVKDYMRNSFYGGLTMTGNKTIKISARELLALLSKQITLEEFLQNKPNVFALNLQAGNLFNSIKVEKCPNSDDDWVIFEFDHDPAISTFTNPNSKID